jgi:hypothetical protein
MGETVTNAQSKGRKKMNAWADIAALSLLDGEHGLLRRHQSLKFQATV